MNVLSVLPREVIDTFLLPKLGWNDLLRLRRTCRELKNHAEDYMRRHPEMAPELEINEKDKNFPAFLAMAIPTKRIFLNNPSGNQFYTRAPVSMARFLEEYGPLVTHLRVEKFSVWCTEKGQRFLEGFPNLVSFQAAETGLKKGRGFRQNPNRTNLPSVFQGLQVLKLYQKEPGFTSGVREVLEEILRRCRSLEHFCIPFPTYYDGLEVYSLYEDGLAEFFALLISTIQQRNGNGEVQGALSRIQSIEFSGFPQPFISIHGLGYEFEWMNIDLAQQAFHQLCSTCTENEVKLFNVRGEWFSPLLLQDWLLNQQLRQLETPLVSFTSEYFSLSFARLNMQNLEKLKLKSSSAMLDLVPSGVGPCNLPMLKSLEVTFGYRDSETVLRYFFDQALVHEQLTELNVTLRFFLPEFDGAFVARLAERLVHSCPRLKKLTIWSQEEGHCEGLVAMLDRFELLEEIKFIGCRALRDDDFVGPDADNPRFLRMTSLKKLSFINFDCMPNLSDVLFASVIRHMRLSQLRITASKPILSVTLQGIQSLLEGPFSQSIEKFSFEEWSLDQVSPEEFQALGKKFRCVNIV